MKQLLIQFSLFLLVLLPTNYLHSQIEKGLLVKGKLVSSDFNSSESHIYTIALKKDHFAFIRLMQKGVDLQVTTYDITGNKVADFDSPNGKNGPELVTLNSTSSGKYRIEVAPFDKSNPIGSYDLMVEIVQSKATTASQQVDDLFIPWNNDHTPGAAVAIVQNGEVIYKKGYGLANLEYGIPVGPSSVFHIASVSKQFTVFSILLLEKQGKLNLDDDIREYIPEVPEFGKTITLRHLASHTSGLRDQWELLSMAGWRMDDVITTEQILKLVSKQNRLNFNPGEEFMYCNTGFTLLGEVVARVSEMSFADFTQKNIFEPLKMNNSLFYEDHEKIVQNRSYSYYASGINYKKAVLSYANAGATSLFTTVEDLSLWALNFSKPTIGDTSIFNQMSRLSVLNNGTTFGGGLGQFVRKYGGLNEIHHGGADAGYRTFLARFPDQKFSVIVFGNTAEFDAGRIAHQIVDIYLGDQFNTESVSSKHEEATESLVIDPEILRTYVGDFELRPGFIITITESNGQLTAKATGQTPVPLIPLSNTEFDVIEIGAKVEFVPNGGENVDVIKLNQNGEVTELHRMIAFDESSVQLDDFTGKYYSEELSTTYHLVAMSGTLVIQHYRMSDVAIAPIKENVFTDGSWLYDQIEFIRNDKNEIRGLNISNSRVRNLYFEKLSGDSEK